MRAAINTLITLLLFMVLFLSSFASFASAEPPICPVGDTTANTTWVYSKYGDGPFLCVGEKRCRYNVNLLSGCFPDSDKCSGSFISIGQVCSSEDSTGSNAGGYQPPAPGDKPDPLPEVVVDCSGDRCAGVETFRQALATLSQSVDRGYNLVHKNLHEYIYEQGVAQTANRNQLMDEVRLQIRENEYLLKDVSDKVSAGIPNSSEIIDGVDKNLSYIKALFNVVPPKIAQTESAVLKNRSELKDEIIIARGMTTSEVIKLGNKIDNLDLSGTDYSGSFNTVNSNINGVSGKLDGVTTSLEGLVAQLNGVSDSVSGLGGSIAGLSTQLTGVEGAVNGVGEKLDGTLKGIQDTLSGKGFTPSNPSSRLESRALYDSEDLAKLVAEVEELKAQHQAEIKNFKNLFNFDESRLNTGEFKDHSLKLNLNGSQMEFSILTLQGLLQNSSFISSILLFIAAIVSLRIIFG